MGTAGTCMFSLAQVNTQEHFLPLGVRLVNTLALSDIRFRVAGDLLDECFQAFHKDNRVFVPMHGNLILNLVAAGKPGRPQDGIMQA